MGAIFRIFPDFRILQPSWEFKYMPCQLHIFISACFLYFTLVSEIFLKWLFTSFYNYTPLKIPWKTIYFLGCWLSFFYEIKCGKLPIPVIIVNKFWCLCVCIEVIPLERMITLNWWLLLLGYMVLSWLSGRDIHDDSPHLSQSSSLR